MFYVSSLSGSVAPFVPGVSQIAKPSQEVAPAAPLNFESQVVTQSAAQTISTNTVTRNTVTTENNEEPQNDEAVVFAKTGMVRPGLTPIVADSSNISRASAAMAYRIQEPEDTEQETAAEDILPAGRSSELDNESSRSHIPVSTIKNSNYQQPESKERKAVTVASDIMTAPVFTLLEQASLFEAQQAFKIHRFRHIPIVNHSGSMVGIISDRNVMGEPIHANHSVPIRDRMVTNILMARPSTDIRSIAQVMIEHRIGCLPLIGEGDRLVGILTRTDILRAIVKRAPVELWT